MYKSCVNRLKVELLINLNRLSKYFLDYLINSYDEQKIGIHSV